LCDKRFSNGLIPPFKELHHVSGSLSKAEIPVRRERARIIRVNIGIGKR
jgi:hypothetical protein